MFEGVTVALVHSDDAKVPVCTYIDERGHAAVRLPHAALRAATGPEGAASQASVAKAYREWLAASLSLYPAFWRAIATEKSVVFVCSCERQWCHGMALLGWMKEHGSCVP